MLARRYAHGAAVDEPLVWYAGLADRRWLIADHQGSVIASTDASGATTRHAYGSYGEPAAWTGPRFRYTGQIALPEIGLYHYKARVYDPVLGRFLQTDPVGYDSDLNLYAYVADDPVGATDPSGLERICAAPTGSRINSCVGVDADGDGDSSDDDLNNVQASALARSFRPFILRNAGMDLKGYGAVIGGGFSQTDETMVRATSQFIGPNLTSGWGNTVIYGRPMGQETAGQSEWIRNEQTGPAGLHRIFLNMAWGDHRSNPSGLARTTIHEFLHRREHFGYVVPRNAAHLELDSRAQENLRTWGLGAGGCLPVGQHRFFGLVWGGYPGC